MNLSIVVPCYNEEESLLTFYNNLIEELKSVDFSFEIVLVDDGSKDRTTAIIQEISNKDNRIKAIVLSRNFGHQAALVAGIENASGDYVLTMDSDLQHPVEFVVVLYNKAKEGFDIVNTIRQDSEDSSIFKKQTSKFFYKLINSLSEVPIQSASADFRVFSKKAKEAFLMFPERARFNRGIVSWMGFDTAEILYKANNRIAGNTKFSISKMIKFALNGITSFSSKPLRIPFYLGLISVVFSLIFTGYILIQYINGETIQGWASTLIIILFLGGVQMFSIGILGQYIARIFDEAKNRPLYLIKEKINFDR